MQTDLEQRTTKRDVTGVTTVRVPEKDDQGISQSPHSGQNKGQIDRCHRISKFWVLFSISCLSHRQSEGGKNSDEAEAEKAHLMGVAVEDVEGAGHPDEGEARQHLHLPPHPRHQL